MEKVSNNLIIKPDFKVTITGLHSGEVVEFNAYGWHTTVDDELVCTIEPEEVPTNELEDK